MVSKVFEHDQHTGNQYTRMAKAQDCAIGAYTPGTRLDFDTPTIISYLSRGSVYFLLYRRKLYYSRS